MTVYHTSKCRINWTSVVGSSGAETNVVRPDRNLTLLVGAFVDPGLQNVPGGFVVRFTIVNSQGRVIDHQRMGWTPTEFGVFGNIWLAMSWLKAIDAIGDLARPQWFPSPELFLFKPRFMFQVWTSDVDASQFAVAPEDYYFLIK